MKKADVAIAVEWVGSLGAFGAWIGSGVYQEYRGLGRWFVSSSHTMLFAGLGLVAVTLAARRWRTGHFLRRTPFDLPVLLLLMGALTGWLASYDRERSLLRFFLLFSAAVYFYLLADANPGAAQRYAGGIYMLQGLVLGAFFWTQHDFVADPVDVALFNRIGLFLAARAPDWDVALLGPLSVNSMASIQAMAVPFCLAWMQDSWRRRKVAQGLLAAVVLVCLSIGILVSASWGAWAALAGAALLWGVRRGTIRLAGKGARAAIFLVVLAAILAVYGYVMTRSDVMAGLPTGASAMNRATLYRDGWYLANDYPFTGAGLENYQMVHASYSLLTHVGYIRHPHQMFLYAWIDQGLPGLAAILGLAAVTFWLVMIEDDPAEPRRWHLSAAGWCAVIMLLRGLVDVDPYNEGEVNILLVPFGLMMAGRVLPLRAPAPPRVVWRWVGLAVLAVVAVVAVWGQPILSAGFSNLGALEQTKAELRVYAWPKWPIQDAVRREVDLSGAIDLYQSALAHNPRNATANRRLGMIAMARGEYQAALEYLEAAYEVTPGDNATRQWLGEAYIVNGRLDEGAALWKEVNVRQSQLDLRAFWYRYVGDEQRAAWVRQVADSRKKR